MDELFLNEMLSSDPKKTITLLDEKNEHELVSRLWNISLDGKAGKHLRKAAKKALYIIKSKGIEIDRYRPVIKNEVRFQIGEKKIDSCYLSIPDSINNYILILTLTDNKNLSYDFYFYLLNYEKGIMEDHREEKISKKSIHKYKEKTKGLFDISSEYGKFRLKKALDVTEKEKVKTIHIPSILLEGFKDEMKHPVLEILPTNISHLFNQELEEDMFKQEEILQLSIPEEYVEEAKREVEKAKNSLIIIGNKTPQERVEDIIGRFYTIYFTPERREMYVMILMDVALYFHQQEKDKHARLLIDWARELLNQNVPPEEHPFLNFLVYKVFGQS